MSPVLPDGTALYLLLHSKRLTSFYGQADAKEESRKHPVLVPRCAILTSEANFPGMIDG